MIVAYACLVVCAGITACWITSYHSLIMFSVRLNDADRFQVNGERGQLAWSWHRREIGEVRYTLGWKAIPFEVLNRGSSMRSRRVWPPEPSLLGFALRNEPTAWRGIIPCWLPILITVALAAVLKPKPRWQMGTRDLLVITTLLAVGLTVVVLSKR